MLWGAEEWGEVEEGIGGTDSDDSTLSLPLGLLFTISSASSSYVDVFHVSDFALLLFSLPPNITHAPIQASLQSSGEVLQMATDISIWKSNQQHSVTNPE